MAARYLIAGATAGLTLLVIQSGWLEAADAKACQIVGSWSATYTWQGGESRGLVVFTVHDNEFLGKTIRDENVPEGAQTIRGKISNGTIRKVEVFHSRRGWVSAHSSTDDTCSIITIDLPDARVSLKR